jgi:hypothetical protein
MNNPMALQQKPINIKKTIGGFALVAVASVTGFLGLNSKKNASKSTAGPKTSIPNNQPITRRPAPKNTTTTKPFTINDLDVQSRYHFEVIHVVAEGAAVNDITEPVRGIQQLFTDMSHGARLNFDASVIHHVFVNASSTDTLNDTDFDAHLRSALDSTGYNSDPYTKYLVMVDVPTHVAYCGMGGGRYAVLYLQNYTSAKDYFAWWGRSSASGADPNVCVRGFEQFTGDHQVNNKIIRGDRGALEGYGVHEILHVLGVPHVFDDRNDIMYVGKHPQPLATARMDIKGDSYFGYLSNGLPGGVGFVRGSAKPIDASRSLYVSGPKSFEDSIESYEYSFRTTWGAPVTGGFRFRNTWVRPYQNDYLVQIPAGQTKVYQQGATFPLPNSVFDFWLSHPEIGAPAGLTFPEKGPIESTMCSVYFFNTGTAIDLRNKVTFVNIVPRQDSEFDRVELGIELCHVPDALSISP